MRADGIAASDRQSPARSPPLAPRTAGSVEKDGLDESPPKVRGVGGRESTSAGGVPAGAGRCVRAGSHSHRRSLSARFATSVTPSKLRPRTSCGFTRRLVSPPRRQARRPGGVGNGALAPPLSRGCLHCSWRWWQASSTPPAAGRMKRSRDQRASCARRNTRQAVASHIAVSPPLANATSLRYAGGMRRDTAPPAGR